MAEYWSGDTALIWALKRDYEEIAMTLVQIDGIHFNANCQSHGAIVLAAFSGFEKIVIELLKKEELDLTSLPLALFDAIMFNHKEVVVELLKDNRIDLNGKYRSLNIGIKHCNFIKKDILPICPTSFIISVIRFSLCDFDETSNNLSNSSNSILKTTSLVAKYLDLRFIYSSIIYDIEIMLACNISISSSLIALYAT